MSLVYNSVTVQRLVSSPHATGYYKFARQRKPVSTIDLTGVSSMSAFAEVWRESVGMDGSFSLLAFDHKGRTAKCLGIIEVHQGHITMKDKRCSLAALIRKCQEDIRRRKEEDFVVTGGHHHKVK